MKVDGEIHDDDNHHHLNSHLGSCLALVVTKQSVQES
jgi:hypothetical protein